MTAIAAATLDGVHARGLPDGRRRDLVDHDGIREPNRLAIHSVIDENKILLDADPAYKDRIAAAAQNPSERAAWLDGSWDIVAGGMFDDIWIKYMKNIIIPPFLLPKSWKITRSFDWGSSKPFSVGWWVESDGADIDLLSGKTKATVPGDLFRIGEWYGCEDSTQRPNVGVHMNATDIAKGILEREQDNGWTGRVEGGVADSSIFDDENDNCISEQMEDEGVVWDRADKRGGSRVQGWQLMRTRLEATAPGEGGPREYPGLFVVNCCNDFIRTIPVLPRKETNLDDVNSDAEDHIGDETRYRLRYESNEVIVGKI